jgi:hypothetical protein
MLNFNSKSNDFRRSKITSSGDNLTVINDNSKRFFSMAIPEKYSGRITRQMFLYFVKSIEIKISDDDGGIQLLSIPNLEKEELDFQEGGVNAWLWHVPFIMRETC